MVLKRFLAFAPATVSHSGIRCSLLSLETYGLREQLSMESEDDTDRGVHFYWFSVKKRLLVTPVANGLKGCHG